MSIPSLLILFFLSTPIVFSYTVITTAGKRIEGTLISEQGSTIVIKDPQGIPISFKKQLLDWKAMSAANAPSPRLENPSDAKPRPKKAEPAIAEIAAESRRQRTGSVRKLTLEDLPATPELSILGSERAEPATIKTKGEQGPDERQWRSRIDLLKREVHRLTERKISAEASCDQTKRKQFEARTTPQDHPTNLLSTYRESSQCSKLREIESQLADAETRLGDAREEGRRAGVSWKILE
jgi:hypothetical protein